MDRADDSCSSMTSTTSPASTRSPRATLVASGLQRSSAPPRTAARLLYHAAPGGAADSASRSGAAAVATTAADWTQPPRPSFAQPPRRSSTWNDAPATSQPSGRQSATGASTTSVFCSTRTSSTVRSSSSSGSLATVRSSSASGSLATARRWRDATKALKEAIRAAPDVLSHTAMLFEASRLHLRLQRASSCRDTPKPENKRPPSQGGRRAAPRGAICAPLEGSAAASKT